MGWTKEPPKGEMFIWAYWNDEKRTWQTGLGYWTVTKDKWADAYNGFGSSPHISRATHFHPMPDPPEARPTGGQSRVALAKEYGVGVYAIRDIVAGDTWGWL